ncbi:hypothetical protein FRACYDRAFT_244783 [Fragilariopsis cylindrus CCMP1102]|uniref:Methyltransferase domain-containing protein n=1 Tax=Fragilariopsis cylindrus CCMP1102 TaxID=635003 RepID=A0A1E7F0Q5_9STRA|nr:hypothetical protein FRACYDRAFT_244783 [Fragilariopsis cylindrus CCMP1102]|eukprot:OEU11664.1 hypothetical protein FRACYDRAFT_244783 [Fragilariopsis cylindrus CCMP1102]
MSTNDDDADAVVEDGWSENGNNNHGVIKAPTPGVVRQKLPRRTVLTIQRELERIARRHRRLLALDSTNTRDRKKILEPRHATTEFHGNYYRDQENVIENENENDDEDEHYASLFDEFARVVCYSKVIPRKELFEAWAMALYVHYYFPPSKEEDHHHYCDESDNENDDGDNTDTGNDNDDDNSNNGNGKSKVYYQRVADLASGHGLVSWAVLLLDQSRTRTAICIDKSIPKSTDIIEQVMTKYHPSVMYDDANHNQNQIGIEERPEKQQQTLIKKRWHYVEGDICRNVLADSTTLIVGVHCCGTLSDSILELAISSNAPLCLIPCCHTVKSLPLEQRQDDVIDSILQQNIEKNNDDHGNSNGSHLPLLPTTKTDYIDQYRIQQLIDAGYTVQEERIPSVITPKNRIIVATPRLLSLDQEDILRDDNGYDNISSGDSKIIDNVDEHNNENNDYTTKHITTATTKNHTSSTTESSKVFTIPLADNEWSRSIVASQLSGRIAARMRKRRKPQNLNLSLYLPHPDKSLPLKSLNNLATTIATEIQNQKSFQNNTTTTKAVDDARYNKVVLYPTIITSVEYGAKGAVYTHPDTGTYSRSFRIKYEINDPTGIHPEVTKEEAKVLHKEVCRRIPIEFPGITLRQGIR